MASGPEAASRATKGCAGATLGDGVPTGGSFAELKAKIAAREAVVGVMGLGYVGLPLIATFHNAGFRAVGFDTSQEKVDQLNKGESYLDHLRNSRELFKSLADSSSFDATTDMGRLEECDAILICVPTPLGDHFEPDLSFVKGCGSGISKVIRRGQLIVLESTTYPGTTREVLLPMMEETGMEVSKDYFLAFSPEREDPGNANHEMYSIPKLVGGIEPLSGQLAVELYKSAFKSVLPVSRSEVAEAAKVVENVYRAVNIALVNELKIVLAKMDIDIWEVLDAAETKPFGFQRFNPGPGWGGHCIPVDPFYLTWKAKTVNMHSLFIDHAGEINIHMPAYVVQHVTSALNQDRKSVNGSRILLLGVAYKSNIGDTRETPAFVIWQQLTASGALVSYYDPHVPVITGHLPPKMEFLQGVESVGEADLGQHLAETDAVVVVTAHKIVPVSVMGGFKGPIVDTRNWATGEEAEKLGLRVFKA